MLHQYQQQGISASHRQTRIVPLEPGSQDNFTVAVITAALFRILADGLGIMTVVIKRAMTDTASVVLGVRTKGKAGSSSGVLHHSIHKSFLLRILHVFDLVISQSCILIIIFLPPITPRRQRPA